MTPVDPTELVAGSWQLRPWPAAYADLDEVLAEQGFRGAALDAARRERLDGWRDGDVLGFAVREITTGRAAGEVVLRIEQGEARVTAVSRPSGPDVRAAGEVVRRWASGALGLSVVAT